MFLLMLVVMCNFVVSSTSEFPVLEFDITSHQEKGTCNSKPITILEGVALRFRVINNSYWKIQYIQCYNGTHYIFETSKLSNNHFQKVKSIRNFGRKWSCLLKKGEYSHKCEVSAHYRTKEPTAFTTLNGNVVDAKTSDLHNKYDAESYYWFEESETIFVECGGPPSGRVEMKYYSAGNSFDDVQNTTRMLLRLTKDDDKNFIVCKYSNELDFTETRLNLYVHKGTSIIRLKINNMFMRPSSDGSFIFYYYEGEKVDVECSTRYDDTNVLDLDYYGQVISNRQSKVDYTMYLNEEHNGTDLRCIAKDKATKSDIKEDISAKFVLRPRDFYILGLNDGKILKQYDSSVIYYEYKDNDQLKLTCISLYGETFSSDYTEILYTWNGGKVMSEKNKNDTAISIYYTFVLDASKNNSKIVCRRRRFVKFTDITINLVHKRTPALYPDIDKNYDGTTENTVINNGNGNKTNSTYVNNKNGTFINHEDTETDTNYWFWIASGAGMLMIAVIIIIIVYYIRNNKIKRLSSDMNDTNLLTSEDPPSVEEIHESNNEEHVLQYAEIMLTNNKAMYKKTEEPEYALIMKNFERVENQNNYENTCNRARYVNCKNAGDDLVEPAYCELMTARN